MPRSFLPMTLYTLHKLDALGRVISLHSALLVRNHKLTAEQIPF